MSNSSSIYPAPKKSTVVGCLLATLLGMQGAHRFYLGRPVSGAAMLLANVGPAGVLLFADPAGWMDKLNWVVIGVLAVVTVVDLTKINRWVREANGVPVTPAPRRAPYRRRRAF